MKTVNDYNENLVIDNINLIHLMIKKMNLYYENDYEYEQYYDAGLEGLIRGAKGFDTSQNIQPSTYLCRCIKNELVRVLSYKSNSKHFNPNGKDISLEHNLCGDDSEDKDLLLIDTIPDTNVNIEEEIQQKIQYENVLNAIEHLTISEDKLFLQYRFGLIDGKNYTYEEISKKFGVSRNRANQRINRALKKLKKYLSKHDKDVFISNKYKPEIYKERKTNNMINKINNLQSLNDYLFEELDRLNNNTKLEENDNLDRELKRSKAITQVAGQIVQNAKVILEAKKHSDMFGDDLNSFYKLDTSTEREKAFIEFKKEH